MQKESKQFSNIKSSASGCCFAFALLFAHFSLVLLIKVLLIEKARIIIGIDSNITDNIIRTFIDVLQQMRLNFERKISMPNPGKSLKYIKCYSWSILRPID